MTIVGFDLKTPNVARMYDYYLGGKDNFLTDQRAAQQVLEKCPEIVWLGMDNRRVLGRVVRECVKHGVRQFLDLGTGLPSQGHVHQVLTKLRVAEESLVIYVDEDPVVRMHANPHIRGSNAVLIAADLRKPDVVLGHPETQKMLDFNKRIAVLAFAAIHFVSERRIPKDWSAPTCRRQRLDRIWPTPTSRTSSPIVPRRWQGCTRRRITGCTRALRMRSKALSHDNDLRVAGDGIVRVTDWQAPDALRPPARRMWVFGGLAMKKVARAA